MSLGTNTKQAPDVLQSGTTATYKSIIAIIISLLSFSRLISNTTSLSFAYRLEQFGLDDVPDEPILHFDMNAMGHVVDLLHLQRLDSGLVDEKRIVQDEKIIIHNAHDISLQNKVGLYEMIGSLKH